MRRTSAIRTLHSVRWWLATPLLIGLAIAALGPRNADAQLSELPPEALLSAVELEEMVGPIALYPDDLVALVLPASTYPLQIVQAARLIEARERNPALEPDPSWDDSVVALLNYPEVIELLNDDLDWTWRLGEAVLAQRADVLDAVQDFRDRAYTAGNLRSDDRQVITRNSGAIEIRPADPEVIYVPYYEPRRVIVRQVYPVFHYYPWAYPVYYYPYPVGYSFYGFRTGFFWGVTSAFAIGWHTHHVHVHHHLNRAHPYFGYRYYDPFYVRRGVNVNINVVNNNVWQPRYGAGARPYRTYADGARVTRSTEGRAYRPQSRSVEGQALSRDPRGTTTLRGPTRDSASTSAFRGIERNGSIARTPAERPATAPQAAARGGAPAERTYRSGAPTTPRASAAPRREGTSVLAAPARPSGATERPAAPRAPAEARSYRTTPQSSTARPSTNAPRAQAARPAAPARTAPQQRSAPRASAPPQSQSLGRVAPSQASRPAQTLSAPRSAPAPRATAAPRAASTSRGSSAPRAESRGNQRMR